MRAQWSTANSYDVTAMVTAALGDDRVEPQPAAASPCAAAGIPAGLSRTDRDRHPVHRGNAEPGGLERSRAEASTGERNLTRRRQARSWLGGWHPVCTMPEQPRQCLKLAVARCVPRGP